MLFYSEIYEDHLPKHLSDIKASGTAGLYTVDVSYSYKKPLKIKIPKAKDGYVILSDSLGRDFQLYQQIANRDNKEVGPRGGIVAISLTSPDAHRLIDEIWILLRNIWSHYLIDKGPIEVGFIGSGKEQIYYKVYDLGVITKNPSEEERREREKILELNDLLDAKKLWDKSKDKKTTKEAIEKIFGDKWPDYTYDDIPIMNILNDLHEEPRKEGIDDYYNIPMFYDLQDDEFLGDWEGNSNEFDEARASNNIINLFAK